MIKFYFCNTANPSKVALFLEEAVPEYEMVPVDTRRGQQFDPDFVALNPNSKLPVIVDGDIPVFDSNAILLYLGQKFNAFVRLETDRDRALTYSWLMFIATGLGPFSGQNTHFVHYAPERVPYALARYQFEATRHYQILEDRLTKNEFILGDYYSIVDMDAWGWVRLLTFVLGEGAWEKYPALKRYADTISARPAAVRALEKLASHNFKKEVDEETRAFMYRHLHDKA